MSLHRLPLIAGLSLVFLPATAATVDAPAPRTTASYLCVLPVTEQVGPVTVGPTPKVCVPFVQWPPVAA
jgi:hypothetical protein